MSESALRTTDVACVQISSVRFSIRSLQHIPTGRASGCLSWNGLYWGTEAVFWKMESLARARHSTFIFPLNRRALERNNDAERLNRRCRAGELKVVKEIS